jgi:hypothetical protein
LRWRISDHAVGIIDSSEAMITLDGLHDFGVEMRANPARNMY